MKGPRALEGRETMGEMGVPWPPGKAVSSGLSDSSCLFSSCFHPAPFTSASLDSSKWSSPFAMSTVEPQSPADSGVMAEPWQALARPSMAPLPETPLSSVRGAGALQAGSDGERGAQLQSLPCS